MSEDPLSVDFIGYLKYEGLQVQGGIIDARAAATALSGFDSTLRYFIAQENSEISAASLPIPVSIQKGSWVAYVPDDIVVWLKLVLGAGAAIYATTAAKKLAENDFKDVSIKSMFRKSFIGIQWCIKIGKHLGDYTQRTFKRVEWLDDNPTQIGILNDKGETLFVPRRYFDIFVKSPRDTFNEIALIIDTGRSLKIGKVEDGVVEEVEVKRDERHIFVVEEENDGEIQFPELIHGQSIIADGMVTKQNGKQNSLGFEYRDHILTCYPHSGSVTRFKPHLYLWCKIVGVIDRSDGHGGFEAPKPKIIFNTLTIINPIEPELFTMS